MVAEKSEDERCGVFVEIPASDVDLELVTQGSDAQREDAHGGGGRRTCSGLW